MPRRGLLAGGLIALAALAAIFLLWNREHQKVVQTVAAPPPAPLPAAAPEPAEVTLSGKIQAANVVNVVAPLDGTIEELMADVGDVVIDGRILARIRNPKLAATESSAQGEAERRSNRIAELESQLIAARLEVSRSEADAARARIEFEKAEKEYQRQQVMFREGITPRLVYEKSQQDYAALKSDSERLAETAKNAVNRVGDLTKELAGARQDLDQQKSLLQESVAESAAGDVRSPADGIIVAKCCPVGEAAHGGSTILFQIASDLTALQVAVSPDATAMARVRPGQPATIAPEGAGDSIPGRVREVNEGQVIVDFTSSSPAVRPGMMARVKIKVS